MFCNISISQIGGASLSDDGFVEGVVEYHPYDDVDHDDDTEIAYLPEGQIE